MRRRVVVAVLVVLGTVLVGVGGAKVREVQVWGFLPPGGREKVRAGREVLAELRHLNPDLTIEEHGWTGHAGIPLAIIRHPEGFTFADDLQVPEGMVRQGVMEEDEPSEQYSWHLRRRVTYEGRLWWDRDATRDGRELSCSIGVEPLRGHRLAEVAVSCFPA